MLTSSRLPKSLQRRMDKTTASVGCFPPNRTVCRTRPDGLPPVGAFHLPGVTILNFSAGAETRLRRG